MTSEFAPTPGFLIYQLSIRWQAGVDRVVAPFGLTHAQYSVLASLRGMTRDGGCPSQRELADHIGLEPVFVSKLVRTLEQNGLIERRDHPRDSRAYALALTPAGVRTITPAIDAVIALQEQLTAPLGGLAGSGTKQLVKAVRKLLAETVRTATTPGEEADP